MLCCLRMSSTTYSTLLLLNLYQYISECRFWYLWTFSFVYPAAPVREARWFERPSCRRMVTGLIPRHGQCSHPWQNVCEQDAEPLLALTLSLCWAWLLWWNQCIHGREMWRNNFVITLCVIWHLEWLKSNPNSEHGAINIIYSLSRVLNRPITA